MYNEDSINKEGSYIEGVRYIYSRSDHASGRARLNKL